MDSEEGRGLKRRGELCDGDQQPRKSRPTNSSSAENASDPNGVSQQDGGAPKNVANTAESNCAGMVEKIYVQNFMYHEAMEVELNPGINFVVGRNGSGKSAILMALVIGLGGNASATDRSQSLEEFIKTGERQAVIEVILANRGQLAYKPTTYGQRITVVRTLTLPPGTSSFQIKNEQGCVVSTSREELTHLVTALGIQVDNPISVFNQDLARTFLDSSNPKDNYSLFMRATGLEEIERLRGVTRDIWSQGKADLKVKTQALSVHQNKVEMLGHRWNLLKSVTEQRRKIEALEHELAWALVKEEEALLEDAEKLQQAETEKLEKIQEVWDACTTTQENLNTKLDDLNERITAMQDKRVEFSEEFAVANRKYIRLEAEYAKKRKEGTILNTKMKRQKINERTLINKIKRLEEDNRDGLAEEAHLAQIVTLTKRIKCVQANLLTNVGHKEVLHGKAQSLRNTINVLRCELQDKEHSIGKLRAKIENMQSDNAYDLSIFGALVAKIEDAHARGLFVRKPVGPLGAHIQVRDATWAPAIEAYIRRSLTTFRCHCSTDALMLHRLAEKVAPNLVVITAPFREELCDTAEEGIGGEHPSILSALIIGNVVVANTLVEQHRVERVLLLDSEEEAYRVLAERRLLPRNCLVGITRHGDTYCPDPNYRMFAGAVRPTRIMPVGKEKGVRTLQSDLEEIEAKKAQTKVMYRDEMQQLKVIREELMPVLFNDIKLEEEKERLNNERTKLEEATVYFRQSVVVLRGELQKCRDDIAALKTWADFLKVGNRACKKRLDNQLGKVNQRKKAIDSVEKSIQPCVRGVEFVRARLRALKSESSLERVKHSLQTATVAMCATTTEKRRQAARCYVRYAEQLCKRITTGKTVTLLKQEKAAARVQLRNAENDQRSCEDVGREYNELKAEMKKPLGEVVECRQLLKETKARSEQYVNVNRSVTLQMVFNFKHRLMRQNYYGDIVVDHEAKTLVITGVTPTGRSQTTDMGTFSGGERSLSAVVFIMALWDTVKLPFHFIDELDTSMDSTNRRAIMNMLLGHARQMDGNQFVFITPFDCGNQQPGDVLRMEDPRRV